MANQLEEYLKNVNLDLLFKILGVQHPEALAKMVRHFTTNEATNRDKIVKNYFGQSGIEQIISSITKSLLTSPHLPANADVLDLGAGSGFFTGRVADRMRSAHQRISFYAMDLTPSMLLAMPKRTEITPFIGLAENIKGSIRQAQRFFDIPLEFDAAFSTLMLHHSLQPQKVFESIHQVLKKEGKAIVVDLCEHGFKEFRTEMGDIYLGFNPEDIKKTASRYFLTVDVEKIPGIHCKSSGRSAEIFIATMHNPENKSIR